MACSFRSAQATTLLEFMYHSWIVLSVGGSVWYMIWNLRCTVTIDSVLANSKTERFLIHCERHFSLRLPPSGGIWKYAKAPSTKKTLRDSLSIDMLLSAMSVLVVAQSSSEIPEGLMNNPVFVCIRYLYVLLKGECQERLWLPQYEYQRTYRCWGVKVPVPRLKMLSAAQYFTITAHKDNSGPDLFETLMGSDRSGHRVLILVIRTNA